VLLFQAFNVSLPQNIEDMKIYTSYFANSKALSKEGVTTISIARYSPKWYFGPKYTAVAPTSYMLSSSCSHEMYLQEYAKILNRLNPHKVIADITAICKGKDVALCCYEKPGDFCHRHLLSEWLRKNGYDVKEWEREEKKEQTQQLSLFD